MGVQVPSSRQNAGVLELVRQLWPRTISPKGRGGSSPFTCTNAPVVELVDTYRLRRYVPTGVQVRVLSGVRSLVGDITVVPVIRASKATALTLDQTYNIMTWSCGGKG